MLIRGALHNRAHVKYHDKRHKCPECRKSFGVKEDLKRHQKEVHQKQPERFICTVHGCEKEYSRFTSVKRHFVDKHGALDAKKFLRPLKRH